MAQLQQSLDNLLRDCTVRIGDGQTGGTGFFVARGLVLTCSHVVEQEQSKGLPVTIKWKQQYPAKILKFLPNPYPDLALLQVNLTEHPSVYLHVGVEAGDELYSYGYPDEYRDGDSALSVYEGPAGDEQPLLKLRSAQIRPGMSGAPLLNHRTGGVCGIVKRTRDKNSDLGGRGVPTSTILERISELSSLQQQFHQQNTSWTSCFSLDQLRLLGLAAPPPSQIESYLQAMIEYGANMPYLSLRGFQPSRTLNEIYVPLKVRPQSRKDEKSVNSLGELLELNIAEVLRKHDRPNVLLLGAPGIGKSTLLHQLAQHAWNAPDLIGLDAPHLPIFVPLQKLATSQGSLEDRLNKALSDELSLSQKLPAGFFVDWPAFTGKRWLILLDALDEVPGDERRQFLSWLKGMLKRIGQHRVVITSRPSSYNEGELDDQQFSSYELLPFTQEQTGEFVKKWFDDKSDQFLQELERVLVGDLRSTPLLLMIAAKVYLDQSRLPKRRAQLYQQFVKSFLEEAMERGLKEELGDRMSKVAESVLARLALAMAKHPSQLSADILSDVAATYLEDEMKLSLDEAKADGATFVQVMGRRSGIFTCRGQSCDFVHSTFRDYLAACALERISNRSDKYLSATVSSRWLGDWREVILFLFGRLSDDEKLVNRLIGRVYDASSFSRILRPIYNSLLGHYFIRPRELTLVQLLFAADCLIDGVSVDKRTESYLLKDLRALARDRRWGLSGRLMATESLGRLGFVDDATTILLEMVRNPQERVPARGKPIVLLMELRRTEALVGLAREEDLPIEIRGTAISAMAGLNRFDELVMLAREGSIGNEISRIAVFALHKLGRVVELAALARNEQAGSDIQQFAMDQLVAANCAAELVALARDDGVTTETRQYAIASLSTLGTIGELIALVRDEHMRANIRQFAIALLGRTNRVEELVRLVHDDRVSDEIRSLAILAIPTAQRVNEMVSLVRNDRIKLSMREIVISQLAIDHIDEVMELIRDQKLSSRIRMLAIGLLIASDHEDKVALLAQEEKVGVFVRDWYLAKELEALLQDESVSPDVRRCAASLLKQPSNEGNLLQLARDETLGSELRTRALGKLVEVNPGAVIGLVRDGQASARIRMAGVAMLSDPGHADDLVTLARDAQLEPKLRLYALSQLLEISGVDALLALVRDPALGKAAATVLRESGRIEELAKLARDEDLDPDTRKFAISQLMEAGRADALSG